MGIEQGDVHSPLVYVIKDGSVSVSKDQARVVAELSAGQSFGELSFLWKSERKATVKAVGDTTLWVLDPESSMRKLSFRKVSMTSAAYLAAASGSMAVIGWILTRWPASGLGLKLVLAGTLLEVSLLLFENTLNGISNWMYTGEASLVLETMSRLRNRTLPIMPLLAIPRIFWIMRVRDLTQPWLRGTLGVVGCLAISMSVVDFVLTSTQGGPRLRQASRLDMAPLFAYVMREKGPLLLLAVVPSALVLLQFILVGVGAWRRGQGPLLLLGGIIAFALCASTPGSPKQSLGELVLEVMYLVGIKL